MLTADQIVHNAGLGAPLTQGQFDVFVQFLNSWEATAGLALVVSAVLLAMIYMFSVLFRNDNLKNYVKLEITELFVTVIIVGLLIGGVHAAADLKFSTLSPIAPTSGIPQDANIYNLSERFFVETDKDMAQWLELNYVVGAYLDSMASATPYARSLGIGLVAAPLAGLTSPFKQLIYNMSVALAVAFVINYAQLMVYLFSLAASLYYYIPLGIILRSFTPTRRVGGAIIAIGIVFLFLFPALYSLNYMMFYSAEAGKEGPMVTFRSFLNDNMDASKGFFPSMKTFYQENQSAGFLDLITEGIGGIGKLLTSVIGTFFTMFMVLPLSVVGRAFALGFILPAFNTLLIIQASRHISRAIGEEVDISALTRLI